MTIDELYKNLSYVNHSREQRQKYALMVLGNTKLLPMVLELALRVDDKQSPRAAWLLEFVARENLNAIIPIFDTLFANIHTVHKDAGVRPMAKICEYVIEAYYNNTPEIKAALTPTHKEQIIENCFDWMINDEKIAPKAYAMNTLYLLGQDYDWIHPELVTILERDYQMQSSGFKARARRILKQIKS